MSIAAYALLTPESNAARAPGTALRSTPCTMGDVTPPLLRTVRVVADDTDREGGYVVARLREVAQEVAFVDRDELTGDALGESGDLVLLLGSTRAAHDPEHAAVVAAEAETIRASLDVGVPVLGICYGAQLLARALGGSSERGPQLEIGLLPVESYDVVRCPPGPWVQSHSDVLVPPPGAEVLAFSELDGHRVPQCLADSSRRARALAWQFHPEAEPETFARWAAGDEKAARLLGRDVETMVAEVTAAAPASRQRARRLVDDALGWVLAQS